MATEPGPASARGAAPRVNLRTWLGLFMVAGHLLWAAAYFHAGRHGLMSVDAARFMMGTNVFGMLLFFPVRQRRLRAWSGDSKLVLGQIVWASGSAIFGFALAPALRPALLQTLCMIQMFGFLALRPRQLALAGGCSVALLLGAAGFGAAGLLPHFHVRADVWAPLLTALLLAMLTAITMHHSRRRDAIAQRGIELDEAVAAVRALAMRDALTGLFNRRHMLTRLYDEHARAARTGRPFAVALIDIDHFKHVNDGHGHAVGDDVLRQFGSVAAAAMRGTDTLARWGGEEFLVLMPQTEVEAGPERPLERLRGDLRAQPAGSVLARLGVTFSAGIAVQRANESVEQTIARADTALYAAKRAGRDRCAVDDAASVADVAPALAPP